MSCSPCQRVQRTNTPCSDRLRSGRGLGGTHPAARTVTTLTTVMIQERAILRYSPEVLEGVFSEVCIQ